MDIEDIINLSLKKVNLQTIRSHQEKVIKSYLCGKDVLFCSPTGSGKSLTFELSPIIFKEYEKTKTATVIVVSPLVALMKTQTEKCLSLGLKAVYISDIDNENLNDSLVSSIEKLTVEDIRDGEADIIFTSPESILVKHRSLVADLEKGHHLKAIFIDEAHCIQKFGMSDDKNKEAFRPTYSELGELRSLTQVPVIALTATASIKTRQIIKEKLCIHKCEEIIVSPNKPNTKYWIHEASGRLYEDFDWLVDLLLEKGINAPRIIIFMRKIKHIGNLYEHLDDCLEERGYVDFKPDGPNDDRNRLFDMFHSKTDEVVKESIRSNFMDPCGLKRVLLVSSSFSMGLDVQGVDHIIHYGPAHNVEDYLQETGRAGRQGSQAHAILLKYKQCLSGRNIANTCMRQYTKGSSCRRVQLLQHFESVSSEVKPAHDCCDVCSLHCKCYCQCSSICKCEGDCGKGTSIIMDKILSAEVNIGYASSDTTPSSDSEVDQHTRRKAIVLISSDSE